MIEEIKKRLKAGEVVELECIDREGFLGVVGRMVSNEKILQQGALRVDYIDYDGDIMLNGCIGDLYYNRICSEEFKYFSIKEKAKNTTDITSHTHKGVTSGSETTAPKRNPTFDDLIDIAVKAQKYGLIHKVEIVGRRSLYLSEKPTSKALHYCLTSINDGINFINSLYIETFVIESLADIGKIKLKGKLYQNGFEYEIDQSRLNNLQDCKLFLLKGATVTQKRGK